MRQANKHVPDRGPPCGQSLAWWITGPEGTRLGRGDVWTWTALDADSKLIIS